MKVKELIRRLKTLEQDREVILSRDEEGNGFELLRSIEPCLYDADERQSSIEELTDEMRTLGYSEDDVLENGIPAVCLWP